jgi:asparagine synthase (glutamine-hydrolysing)
MCGFVGLVDKNNTEGKHTTFMNYALKDLYRRGPDSQLLWKSEDKMVEFGFARLAIRDLSESGNQPMQSKSLRYTMVYNGETYNTDELCSWANIDKHELKGHSDTEIILTCFESMGIEKTVQKMDGIFAIALYDTQ